GIAWLRRFLRRMAEEGRTVLVSSHVLSEVEQTVDNVVIINRGTLVRQGSIAELAEQGGLGVLVRGPDLDRLVAGLAAEGTAGPQGREVGGARLRRGEG